MTMSNLVKRAIFGALYVAVMLMAVDTTQPIIFISVFSLLAFIGIWEYSSIVEVNRTRQLRTILDGLAAAYLIAIVHLGVVAGAVVYLLYLLFVVIRSIYSGRELQPIELAKTLLGQVYVALPLAAAAFIKIDYSTILLLGLVCIWSNDTGAFLAGSTLGKSGRHKLFPSVSPKKSWEGFYGGVIASALAAYLLVECTSLSFPINSLWAIFVGVLISIFATWGDLFESMLKRQAGVKDSGAIIPGHGGVLDRIDSILFVMPMLALLIMIIVELGFHPNFLP